MANAIFRSVCIKGSNILYCQSLNLSKHYSRRALLRKPIRVHNISSEDALVPPIREEDFSHQKQLVNKSENESSLTHPRDKTKDIIVPPYEKLQKNDSRFTKVISLIKNRKQREKYGRILLEGKRLINDALAAGIELKAIYFSREADLADIKFRNLENVELCKVLYNTLKVWSTLTTCPGIMGVFKKPTLDDLKVLSEPVIPVTVICDNIRDPGNLGSIIRNAAAAGCQNIILTKGCVDPWEVKVLRAGCGGHFRIPIVNNVEWIHITNYITKDSTIFVADNSSDITEHSYNSNFINFDETTEGAEEMQYVAINEQNQPIRIDETYDLPEELEKYEDLDFPCYLYSSVKYPKKDIVLYIGGETQGIDPRVAKLICNYGGKKIKIPLENGMESLNSTFAMTIVLYEIKRQCTETYVTKE